MKKALFFMLLLVIGLTAMAQQGTTTLEPQWTSIISNSPETFQTQLISSTENSIKVNVSVPGFYKTTVTTPQGEAYVITVPKSVSTAHAGEPDVPMTGIPIMIGDKARMNARVIDAQYMDFENFEVAPSKGDFPRSIDPATVPYTYGECYSQNAFFPASNLDLYEPYIIRDIRGQNLAIYPFAYNPVTKTLRVYYNMTVEMYKVDDQGTNVIANRRGNTVKLDPDFKSMYQRHFINYEASMNRYTPLDENGDLLIICYDNFISSMTDFVNWKKTRGINTTIVSTNTTGTTYSAIKTYIQNQYNANNNITHVLLVGDVAQIPGYSYSGGGSSYSGLGDNAYGQIVGNDVYNDVIIGRFSASSAARVTTQCNRAIAYERDLNTSATWLQVAEGISRKENGSGHNNEDDYEHMNNIRTDLLNYGYTTVYQRYANLTGYTATSSQISTDINSGVGIINYANHGQETAWGSNQSGYVYYANSHVNALTNENKLPFIFSVACLVGKYDHSSDCFAEAWMNATNNNNPTGAVGTLMSYISQPWIPPMWAQDECIDILVGSGTATNMHTYGGIAINGLMGIFDHYSTSEQSAVGTYQAWIVYGDPSLMVRTKTPQAMTVTHSGNLPLGTNTYSVNVSNGNGAVATITDANHNILGKATVSNGTATITVSGNLTANQQLTLCVFGYNKVTYLGTINVIATGEQYTISANVNPTGAGTVSGTGTFYENTTHQLTATANTGYGFTNWTLNGSEVSASPSYTFTVTGNATYTANFHALQLHHITYDPQQTHGTISVSPANAYAGDIVTLTATPNAGYVLDYWDVSTATRGNVTVTNNQFTMPDEEVTVSAYFKTAKVAGDYELVTAAETDWSGEYVIAYVASSTSARVLTGKASGGNYGAYTNATIDNDVLAAADVASYKVTIEKVSGTNNYTIKQGSNYLALTSNGNYLYFATSIPNQNKTRYYWAIAYSSSTLTITNASYTSRRIQWNNSNGSYRFACYTGTQQEISLFKKIENNCATPEDLAVVDNSVTTDGATVSWTGSSDSYKVQYAEANAASMQDVTILSEGFEGNSLPSGWNNSTYTGNQWIIGTGTGHTSNSITATSTAATGNYNIRYYSSTASNNAYLITPVMNLANASEATLTFNYANPAWSGGYYALTIYYRVNGGAWTQLTQYTTSQDSWTGKTVPLTGLDDNYQIGFYVTGYNNDYGHGVGIDDIAVTAKVFNGSWTTASGSATSPYTLSNLDPETSYLVRVIGVCDGMESDPSQTVGFTTEVSCPAPTGLSITDLMATSATLNWTSDAGQFNVRYGKPNGETAVFFDGFENGNLVQNGWTLYAQGDEPNGWYAYDASSNWTNHDGNYSAASFSWYNNTSYNADNWLISPQVTLQGKLKFWVYSNYSDEYEVKLSTTGTAATDFTVTLQGMTAAANAWTEISIPLDDYAGQQGHIAIHHVFYDGNILLVDDFGIYGYSYDWTEVSANTNSLAITGLDQESDYGWQVQANCGSTDGMSSWSHIGTFTTPSACSTPDNLTATATTATTADLSWAGYTDTYNVQYREGDPTAPATIILTANDVWGDGSGYQMLLDADANMYGQSFSDFSDFEYTIPANAVYDINTSTVVVSNSVSIQIPAGTYDYSILNPSPDYNAIYVAGSNGNVGGKEDNYVFEAGKTYEFELFLLSGEEGDGVNVTVTDNNVNAWTTISGVTNPHALQNLNPATTYEVRVQGVNCDGNGSNTDWSGSAWFETEAQPACPVITAADLPYTEDFEDFTDITNVNKTGVMPECWTLAHEYFTPLADTAKPQIYYANGKPAEGDYCLGLFGRVVVAMPQLGDDLGFDSLKMGFYLRQHTRIAQLEVGVLSELDNAESFTPIDTLDNGSNSDPQYYVVDLRNYQGSGKHIAFRNSLIPGYNQVKSVQYIDSISLFVANSQYDPHPDAECNGISLPYSQDFDNLTSNSSSLTGVMPDCWDFAPEQGCATDAQIYCGSANASSGSYSLYMSGLGTVVLPEINNVENVSGLSMKFSVRQKKFVQRLQVGVMDDPDDASSFVKVADIYNGGNYTSPQEHIVKFSSYSGNGKHIAFRNVTTNSTSISENWIDDIHIYDAGSVSCGISVPYTQGFETGDESLECWNFFTEAPNTTEPQLSSDNAQSGSHSFYMSGRGYLVLPEITNVNDMSSLSMSFYVKQRKYAQRLEIGVMSVPTDPATFVKIADIYNGGNYATPVEHTVDFASYPGSGRYIVFRNVATTTSTVSQNWIDDISIFTTDTRNLSAHNGGFSADGENGYTDEFEEVTAPLGVDEFDLSDFSVWPNPTTGLLTLATEAQRVEILSLMGQRVAVFENTSSVNISDLPAGVYILKAILPQGEAVRKVVKR